MTDSNTTPWLDAVRFNSEGLVPVIAQDIEDSQILMMAWMNREALELTARENQAVYWSRSRQSLWRKGETSGNVQKVHEIRLDCDGDTLILKVTQIGGAACHTGRRHCFFQKLDAEHQWQTVEAVVTDPAELYGPKGSDNSARNHRSVPENDSE